LEDDADDALTGSFCTIGFVLDNVFASVFWDDIGTACWVLAVVETLFLVDVVTGSFGTICFGWEVDVGTTNWVGAATVTWSWAMVVAVAFSCPADGSVTSGCDPHAHPPNKTPRPAVFLDSVAAMTLVFLMLSLVVAAAVLLDDALGSLWMDCFGLDDDDDNEATVAAGVFVVALAGSGAAVVLLTTEAELVVVDDAVADKSVVLASCCSSSLSPNSVSPTNPTNKMVNKSGTKGMTLASKKAVPVSVLSPLLSIPSDMVDSTKDDDEEVVDGSGNQTGLVGTISEVGVANKKLVVGGANITKPKAFGHAPAISNQDNTTPTTG
jgi:hypothetical protein